MSDLLGLSDIMIDLPLLMDCGNSSARNRNETESDR